MSYAIQILFWIEEWPSIIRVSVGATASKSQWTHIVNSDLQFAKKKIGKGAVSSKINDL